MRREKNRQIVRRFEQISHKKYPYTFIITGK